MAYSLLSPPNEQSFLRCANKLVETIEVTLHRVLDVSHRQRSKGSNLIDKRKSVDPFCEVIRRTYHLWQKIQVGVLSEVLHLSKPNTKMVPPERGVLEVANMFKVPGRFRGSEAEKVLGGVSFGLYGIGQDGNQKIYMRPRVTVGLFKNK